MTDQPPYDPAAARFFLAQMRDELAKHHTKTRPPTY
jgi:hypothetical protein